MGFSYCSKSSSGTDIVFLQKPGRWCGMHVKIANDIAAYRQSQQQKDKQIAVAAAHAEQRVRAAAAAGAPPLSIAASAVASTSQTAPSVATAENAAAAQLAMQQAAMAARVAGPQPPHCLPSTSSSGSVRFVVLPVPTANIPACSPSGAGSP